MRTSPNTAGGSNSFFNLFQHHHGGHSHHRSQTTPVTEEHHSSTQERPEALPSKYQERFNGQPVSGTVVIGPDFPELLFEERCHPHEASGDAEPVTYSDYAARHQSEFFELVTPDGESIEKILRDFDTPIDSADSVENSGGQPDSEKRRKSILNEGGFVIFSDAYLEKHPDSSITNITRQYQLLSGAKSVVDRYAGLEDITDEKKAKVEILKQYIQEADLQERPLFRRKNSEIVYGHANYKGADK
ncbi:hypothetical protein, conserved [Angomonas deanei]|uniref:Uncharacterized protein n=1 Tax=Angomonas deanei TaxID=59799 RepID=A0A7G2C1B8_9TRYP|nr:hypothetical protein, conserved [Angomonas deanei]